MSDQTTHIDLVFHPDLDSEQAHDAAEAAAGAWADTSVGVQAGEPQQIGDLIAYRRWWQPGPPAVAMDLTSDASVPVNMLSIVSADPHAAVALAELVWPFLNGGSVPLLCTPEELLATALDPAAQPADLVRAAIPFKRDPQPGLQRRLEASLAADDPDWQRAAAKAAALAAWPGLVPALDRALAVATDEELRRLLQMALSKCGRA